MNRLDFSAYSSGVQAFHSFIIFSCVHARSCDERGSRLVQMCARSRHCRLSASIFAAALDHMDIRCLVDVNMKPHC